MTEKTPRKRTAIHRNAGSRCRCDKVRRYPLRADRARKAASALSGAANADHVLAVFGGAAMPADTVPAESSGGADDILDRDQTLFPDTVDQAVYPMEFEHATPTSGTLTVLVRQQAQSHHRPAGLPLRA